MTKKKIKKFSIIAGFILLFGLAFFAIPNANKMDNVYAASVEVSAETQTKIETEEEFSWKQWFREKVLPMLISSSVPTVAIGGIICAGLKTISTFVQLNKMSKGNFEQVSAKLIESQSNITEFKESALVKMEQMRETFAAEIAAIREQSNKELDAIKNEMREALKQLYVSSENSIKIMKIAFGNSADLVKNGYSHQIHKVGGENEESTQVENKDNIDANT